MSDINVTINEDDINVTIEAGSFSGIEVTEVDGTPDVNNVLKIIFPNGSVTDNEDGSVSIVNLGSSSWGSITGDIEDQTDLQNALDLKANLSSLTSHISDSSIHFTEASISITESQVSNLDKYTQAEVNALIAGVSSNVEASTAEGQMVFADGSGGYLHTETSELFWDDTNKRLGVGTVSPESLIHVEDETMPFMILRGSGAGGAYGAYQGHRANGTLASPTVVTTGFRLFGYEGFGYDGDSYELGGAIYTLSTGTWSNTSRPTALQFYITNNNSTVASEAARFHHNGFLGIGTTSPTEPIHIASNNTDLIRLSRKTGINDVKILLISGNELTAASKIVGTGDANGGAIAFETENSERVIIDGLGNVGINTSTPDRNLDVLDASNPQLRLTHTDGSIYTDFQTDSNGQLVITPTGGSLHIPETTTPTAIANYGGIYTKSDNKLYFQDGGGTEHEVAFV